MQLKRGDLIVVAIPGYYGKPRPALVIQANLFNASHASVVVCLITTLLVSLPSCRLPVQPTKDNGLRETSYIQIDKLAAVPWEKIGGMIGRLDEDTLLQVNRALAVWLGIA